MKTVKTMRHAVTILILLAISSFAWAQESAVVQDFEKPFPVAKYPPDHKGEVAITREWKKDGQYSLKIDPGLMVALDELKVKDWSPYSVLRMHFKSNNSQAIRVGFELADNFNTYYDRHQNAFSVSPGETTVDFDITGALWRGEPQGQYVGKHKTPIDVSKITRMAFTNMGDATIYVDRIELVKLPKIECKGGFAFAFGRKHFPVMSQFTGVDNETSFDAAKGYGMVGKDQPFMISTSMSFPTPLLGNGLGFNAGGFKAVLPGGKYIGWVAFERGGYWEGSAASYKHLALKINGKTVHEHDFGVGAADFLFQDLEILDESQLMDKVIYPASAAAEFKFDADKGENHFTLEVTDEARPPRVAGLILAPDNEQGRAFLKAHLANQAKAFAAQLKMADKGRRKEAGRMAPGSDMVVQSMCPGEDVYPHDWPKTADSKLPGTIVAVPGQKLTVQLGLYAKSNFDVEISAANLRGPGEIKLSEISHGRYLPQRPYGTGVCWLEVHHYRPEPNFDIGPDLSRPMLVEFDVPTDAKPGRYEGKITISAYTAGKCRLGLKPLATATVPVTVEVLPVKLPAIPIPVGLFKNAMQFEPEILGADRWWQLQEQLLDEQGRAGLNMTTGGVGLGIKYEFKDGHYTFTGDDALKYLDLAKKYGMAKAFTSYGGYWALHNFNGDAVALARDWAKFEKDHNLPPFYVYSYDEPRVEEHFDHLLKIIRPFAKTGLRITGYTSENRGVKGWDEMIELSYAPSFNGHTAETFKRYPGKEIWCYNNGLDRYSMGLDMWRKVQLGCKGRTEWIALYEQGFAFDNLDGREPSYCCFKVHSKLGIMKTNKWLTAREGLLDCRIRLALDAAAPADDAARKLWTVDGYRKDSSQWSDEKLQAVREAMLKRLAELSK